MSAKPVKENKLQLAKRLGKLVIKPAPVKPKKKKLVIKEKKVDEPVKPTIKMLLDKYPNEATKIGDLWKQTIDRRNPTGFKKMTSAELYEKHLEILNKEELSLSLKAAFGKKQKMDTDEPGKFIKQYKDRVFNYLSTKNVLEKTKLK